MEIKPHRADSIRESLESELAKIVEKATKKINRKIVLNQELLVNPGYISINVHGAVNPFFGSTPKGLREIAERRVLENYKAEGWDVRQDEYDYLRQAGYTDYSVEGYYRFSLRKKLQ